jgi:hypothetical protein
MSGNGGSVTLIRPQMPRPPPPNVTRPRSSTSRVYNPENNTVLPPDIVEKIAKILMKTSGVKEARRFAVSSKNRLLIMQKT